MSLWALASSRAGAAPLRPVADAVLALCDPQAPEPETAALDAAPEAEGS